MSARLLDAIELTPTEFRVVIPKLVREQFSRQRRWGVAGFGVAGIGTETLWPASRSKKSSGGKEQLAPPGQSMQQSHNASPNLPAIALNDARRGSLHPSAARPSPSMPDQELLDDFLEALERAGSPVRNPELRETLGWPEAQYEEAKAELGLSEFKPALSL